MNPLKRAQQALDDLDYDESKIILDSIMSELDLGDIERLALKAIAMLKVDAMNQGADATGSLATILSEASSAYQEVFDQENPMP